MIKEKYFVKDGSRNCFIAEANLKNGSSIFSHGKNAENAAEEHRPAAGIEIISISTPHHKQLRSLDDNECYAT